MADISPRTDTSTDAGTEEKNLQFHSDKSLAIWGSDASNKSRDQKTLRKFEVEKFDGTTNFSVWQCKIMDVLYQQELDIALEDKPADMGDKEWTQINRQACSTIRSKKQPTTSTSSSKRRTVVSNVMFEVEKFDGTTNFGMWLCEVMDVLYQQELDIALEDKPADMGDKEWTQINRQACSTIRLCLAKEQKYFVMRETSAKELWQKLKDKYMTKSIENRLYLKKKLFRFEYKRGISMIEHLDSFNKILADLQNLDIEIIDEDKTLLLLNSLPDSYDHLTTILLFGKEKITFVDVSNALVNNEYRKKDKSVHKDSTAEALIVKGRTNYKRSGGQGRSRSKSRGRSSDRRRLAKDECAFCHQKGHWKKDCLGAC